MFPQARQICRLTRARGMLAPWQGVPGLGAALASGPEASAFLQAQLTSDVAALEPGGIQLSARLDRRGNLVSWFHLLRLPERGQPYPTFLLVLPAALVPDLVKDLQAYIFNEQVQLEDVSGDFDGMLIQGPATEQLQDELVAVLPPGSLNWPLSLTGDPGLLVLLPGLAEPPTWGLLRAFAQERDWAVLADDESGRAAWGWMTREAGWPSLLEDFSPGTRLLPQTGLEHQAVSYTKGCYLGQEVVARVRTYGSVPEALRALVFPGSGLEELEEAPEPGQPLLDKQGRKIGTWARTAWSDLLDEPLALAFLNRDHRTPGEIFSVQVGPDESLEARVAMLPLHNAGSARRRAEQLHHKAVEAFGRGRDEEAIAGLEECLRLDPSLADAYEALGVILGRTERYHEAIDIFRRLEEVAPAEPMVHTNLSLFYMKVGDRDEAERQKALAAGKRSDQDNVFGLEDLSPGGQDQRQEEAARKQAMFAEVLDIDPEDPLALMGMGQSLLDQGLPEEADPFLVRALAVQKDNSALYLTRAKLLQQLGRDQEAAQVLKAGIAVASRKGDLMPLREMETRLSLVRSS